MLDQNSNTGDQMSTGSGGPPPTPAWQSAGWSPSLVGSNESATTVDTFNQWMRAQPWYQSVLAQYGGNAKSDAAKTAIVRAAQAAGAKIDESNIEVDNTGNLREQGHKLKDGLIVAGIAAAALGTMGAAGVFGGAAAGGADAASAGTLAATAVPSVAAPIAAVGTSGALAAGGAATAAIPAAASADAAAGMSMAGLVSKYGPSIASALSAGAKSAAQGQITQADQQNKQDYLTLAIEKNKQDMQNTAYRNAMSSSRAMNTKDFAFSPIPGVNYTPPTGGSRPSAMGQQGMDAATLMNQKAMAELMNPSTQNATPLPAAGAMQTVGGDLAAGLGIASTVAPIFAPKPGAPTPAPVPATQSNGMFMPLPAAVPLSGGL